MAEIEQLLRKHDVAGVVVLCSGEQSEYLNFVAHPKCPTWSCLVWNENGVRLKAKGSRSHSERFRLQSTVKMVHTMRDVLAIVWGFYDKIAKLTEQHLDIEHGEIAHAPHDPTTPPT